MKRTIEQLLKLRNELINSSNAIDSAKPGGLTGEFFILQFAEKGVTLTRSGVFLSGDAGDSGQLIAHVDGEREARSFNNGPQLGLYPLRDAMTVAVRSLKGVTYDFDSRSDAATSACEARQAS